MARSSAGSVWCCRAVHARILRCHAVGGETRLLCHRRDGSTRVSHVEAHLSLAMLVSVSLVGFRVSVFALATCPLVAGGRCLRRGEVWSCQASSKMPGPCVPLSRMRTRGGAADAPPPLVDGRLRDARCPMLSSARLVTDVRSGHVGCLHPGTKCWTKRLKCAANGLRCLRAARRGRTRLETAANVHGIDLAMRPGTLLSSISLPNF